MNASDQILLSKSQKKTVEDLKTWVHDELNRTEPFICDHFLVRYLEARKWKIPKTQKMLRGYFEYRDRMIQRLPEHRRRLGRNYKTSIISASISRIRRTTTLPSAGQSIFLYHLILWKGPESFWLNRFYFLIIFGVNDFELGIVLFSLYANSLI